MKALISPLSQTKRGEGHPIASQVHKYPFLFENEYFFLQFGLPSTGEGGVLGLIFALYVPLASQSPFPIIVYSVANCKAHLSHFWANM